MDPRDYVPAYLERRYASSHPDLTEAARALVREQLLQDPDRFAADQEARALISYMRIHEALERGLSRMEDLPDLDFERRRADLFEQTRGELDAIAQSGHACVDARLVSIQLADMPLDACLGDMLQLERETREHLLATRPGFNPAVTGL